MAPPDHVPYRPLMAVQEGTASFAPAGLLWAYVVVFAVLLVALQASGN